MAKLQGLIFEEELISREISTETAPEVWFFFSKAVDLLWAQPPAPSLARVATPGVQISDMVTRIFLQPEM